MFSGASAWEQFLELELGETIFGSGCKPAAMEFCVGCGSDLPSSKKYVRSLSFGSSGSSCAVTLEVTSTWKNLMKEIVEEEAFTDESICLRCEGKQNVILESMFVATLLASYRYNIYSWVHNFHLIVLHTLIT